MCISSHHSLLDMLLLSQPWSEALNLKQEDRSVSLDISQAINTWHPALLAKLAACSTKGYLPAKNIALYSTPILLTGRQQAASIDADVKLIKCWANKWNMYFYPSNSQTPPCHSRRTSNKHTYTVPIESLQPLSKFHLLFPHNQELNCITSTFSTFIYTSEPTTSKWKTNYTNFTKLIKNTKLEYLGWISVHLLYYSNCKLVQV